jgi:hypothetical protein
MDSFNGAKVIIGGDWNINFYNKTNCIKDITEFCYNIKPRITRPESEETCLLFIHGLCFFPFGVCLFLSFPLLPKPSSPFPLLKTIQSPPPPSLPTTRAQRSCGPFFMCRNLLDAVRRWRRRSLAAAPRGPAGAPPKRGTLLVFPHPTPHNDALAVNVIIIRIQNSATKVDVFSILYLNIIKNIFCYEINNATN